MQKKSLKVKKMLSDIDVGKQLSHILLDKGVAHSWLSEQMGRSRQNIGQLLQRKFMALDTLLEFCILLEIKLNDLIPSEYLGTGPGPVDDKTLIFDLQRQVIDLQSRLLEEKNPTSTQN